MFCSLTFVRNIKNQGHKLPQSLQVTIQLTCSGFFIGFVVDKYSPRTCGVIGCLLHAITVALSFFANGTTFLIISLGVVGGISSRLFLISGLRIISLIFEGTAKPMALSIYITSISVADVPYPYFLRYLSDTYGLQWTFVIAGSFMSTSVLLATTWAVPKPTITLGASSNVGTGLNNKQPFNSVLPLTESRKQASGASKLEVSMDIGGDIINDENCLNILKTLLSNPSFVFFAIGQAFTHGAFRALGFFITDVLKDRNFTAAESTVTLMVFNFSGIAGGLLPGLVKKLSGSNSFTTVIVATLASAPAIVGFIFVTGQASAVIISTMLGLGFGTVLSSNAVSVLSLVSNKHYAPAVGLTYGATGIVIAVTWPLSGLIRDSSNSYTGSLLILESVVFCGTLLFLFAAILRRRITEESQRASSTRNTHSSQQARVQIFTITTKL